MSIPSADHTIYGFITLCLKEQGDIAGRKEITTERALMAAVGVECHHRQRHISVTALRARKQGLGEVGGRGWLVGGLKRRGGPTTSPGTACT